LPTIPDGLGALSTRSWFLQAQAGDFAHDLDDFDLLVAAAFRMTSNSVCSSAGGGRAAGDHDRGGEAAETPTFFQQLAELALRARSGRSVGRRSRLGQPW